MSPTNLAMCTFILVTLVKGVEFLSKLTKLRFQDKTWFKTPCQTGQYLQRESAGHLWTLSLFFSISPSKPVGIALPYVTVGPKSTVKDDLAMFLSKSVLEEFDLR